jgi:CRP-like cAMP-binding protein
MLDQLLACAFPARPSCGSFLNGVLPSRSPILSESGSNASKLLTMCATSSCQRRIGTLDCDQFFEGIRRYAELSEASTKAWQSLLRPELYRKNECFIRLGQIPEKVAFVLEGLFSQEYVSKSGDTTIKYFFPEGRFAASVGAMLAVAPSAFSVVALEETRVLSYTFSEFKRLTEKFSDVASFYIRYMERHWIIEKEPLEISFRYDAAVERYYRFLNTYPGLVSRLKKHQIASYLGITPTQLSRLLRSGK